MAEKSCHNALALFAPLPCDYRVLFEASAEFIWETSKCSACLSCHPMKLGHDGVEIK
jgi:hypothetical protein